MRDLLKPHDNVELLQADAGKLPFDDATFDLVYSGSALEHFVKTAEVLRETRRVTRRGGLAQHTVHFWFGPTGGHSLCSLDFPWGHARLTPTEFERYLQRDLPAYIVSVGLALRGLQ